MTDLLVSVAIAAVVLVVWVVRALRTRPAVESLARESARTGLALTPAVLPLLVRRRRATWLGDGIGTAVGIVASSGLQEAFPAPGDLTTGLARSITWLALGGVGALVGGAIGARVVRPSGLRVARGRAVALEDYVTPSERRTARILAGVALGMGVVPLLRDGWTAEAVASLLAGAGVAAAGVVAEVVARAIVARPQRADSTTVLAWDDAERSATVRGLLQSVGILAVLVLVVIAPAAVAAFGAPAARSATQGGALWAAVVVLALGAIQQGRRGPSRWFLHRLWPETAAQAEANERAVSGVAA